MHPTTAKLMILHQKESFISAGWPAGIEDKLEAEVVNLRREIPPEVLMHYDRLKHEGRIPVVPVAKGKCQGCHATLSKAAQSQLADDDKLHQCARCARFIYVRPELQTEWVQAELIGSSTKPVLATPSSTL